VRAAPHISAPCVTAVSALLGIAGCSATGLARRHVEVSALAARRVEQAGLATRNPGACNAILNAAALTAMGQIGPLGQMQIFGDPTSFSPTEKRVEVDVPGGGQFVVDLTIDANCHVLSVTTNSITVEQAN
jgi:hypothetical protein